MPLHRCVEGLTFDQERHLYHYRGRRMRSVTSVIPKTDFSMVAPEVLEYARQRGSAADLAIQLAIEGDLDEDSVDSIVQPYLTAYRLFVADTGWRTVAVQPRLCHPVLPIAGSGDEVGWLHGHRTFCDWKCTAVLPESVRMQVGAYAYFWNLHYPAERVTKGLGLHLRRDGTYSMLPIDVKLWGHRFMGRAHKVLNG